MLLIAAFMAVIFFPFPSWSATTLKTIEVQGEVSFNGVSYPVVPIYGTKERTAGIVCDASLHGFSDETKRCVADTLKLSCNQDPKIKVMCLALPVERVRSVTVEEVIRIDTRRVRELEAELLKSGEEVKILVAGVRSRDNRLEALGVEIASYTERLEEITAERDDLVRELTTADGDNAELEKQRKRLWILIGVMALMLIALLLIIFFYPREARGSQEEPGPTEPADSPATVSEQPVEGGARVANATATPMPIDAGPGLVSRVWNLFFANPSTRQQKQDDPPANRREPRFIDEEATKVVSEADQRWFGDHPDQQVPPPATIEEARQPPTLSLQDRILVRIGQEAAKTGGEIPPADPDTNVEELLATLNSGRPGSLWKHPDDVSPEEIVAACPSPPRKPRKKGVNTAIAVKKLVQRRRNGVKNGRTRRKKPRKGARDKVVASTMN